MQVDTINLLKSKIAFEKELCEQLEGRENDERLNFIGGMEYALDIIENPDNNGIDEIDGYYDMNKKQLEQLKELLEKFASQDYFGIAEMNELEQVNTVIDLVDGAIINLES